MSKSHPLYQTTNLAGGIVPSIHENTNVLLKRQTPLPARTESAEATLNYILDQAKAQSPRLEVIESSKIHCVIISSEDGAGHIKGPLWQAMVKRLDSQCRKMLLSKDVKIRIMLVPKCEHISEFNEQVVTKLSRPVSSTGGTLPQGALTLQITTLQLERNQARNAHQNLHDKYTMLQLSYKIAVDNVKIEKGRNIGLKEKLNRATHANAELETLVAAQAVTISQLTGQVRQRQSTIPGGPDLKVRKQRRRFARKTKTNNGGATNQIGLDVAFRRLEELKQEVRILQEQVKVQGCWDEMMVEANAVRSVGGLHKAGRDEGIFGGDDDADVVDVVDVIDDVTGDDQENMSHGSKDEFHAGMAFAVRNKYHN